MDAHYLKSSELASLMGIKRGTLANYRSTKFRSKILPFFRLTPYPYGRLRFLLSDAVGFIIEGKEKERDLLDDSEVERIEIERVEEVLPGREKNLEDQIDDDGRFVRSLFDGLTHREEKIVRMRFGIGTTDSELLDLVEFTRGDEEKSAAVDAVQRRAIYGSLADDLLPEGVKNIMLRGLSENGEEIGVHGETKENPSISGMKVSASFIGRKKGNDPDDET